MWDCLHFVSARSHRDPGSSRGQGVTQTVAYVATAVYGGQRVRATNDYIHYIYSETTSPKGARGRSSGGGGGGGGGAE